MACVSVCGLCVYNCLQDFCLCLVCACVFVRACVRVCACVCACVRACVIIVGTRVMLTHMYEPLC